MSVTHDSPACFTNRPALLNQKSTLTLVINFEPPSEISRSTPVITSLVSYQPALMSSLHMHVFTSFQKRRPSTPTLKSCLSSRCKRSSVVPPDSSNVSLSSTRSSSDSSSLADRPNLTRNKTVSFNEILEIFVFDGSEVTVTVYCHRVLGGSLTNALQPYGTFL